MCNLNSSASEHTCCCGSIHVKTGTWVIAILAAIGLVLNCISGLVNGYTGSVVSSIVALVVGGIVVACMFYALRTERAGFLLPYIILQILAILLYLIMLIICIVAAASSSQFAHDFINQMAGYSKDIDVKAVAGILIAAYFIAILVQIWFVWVVYKCYIYFRERCC